MAVYVFQKYGANGLEQNILVVRLQLERMYAYVKRFINERFKKNLNLEEIDCKNLRIEFKCFQI